MIIPAALDTGTRTGWPLVSTLPPLAALPTAPGVARAHVGAVLTGWQMGELSDLAQLLTGELATNALRASTTPAGGPCYVNGQMALIWICLMSDTSRLLIEVHDKVGGEPVMIDAAPDAESGRGLQMIDNLTGGEWGWQRKIGQHGKSVWAVLTMPARPARSPSPFHLSHRPPVREPSPSATPAGPDVTPGHPARSHP
jgi:hypothetical protein